MCWSAGASVAMVAAGSVATVVAIRRREPVAIPTTFAYFTFMEGLQAAAYPVIGECGSPQNQVLALLSYVHIAFQPFFANWFAMTILGRVIGVPMRTVAWIACGASAATMLVQLYPFDWAGLCPLGEALCGREMCVIQGDWHLGWTIPYNNALPPLPLPFGFTLVFPTYFVAAFVVPLFYGAWRFTLFHLLFGPILARSLTSNVNEFPAIWCLFSVGIIVIGLHPWFRARIAGPGPAMQAA
jgi:hypothetical protein